MADRMTSYADWLIANQNLKGTPEFDTVASAYKELRQQSKQASQQDGVFTTLAKSIGDSGLRIAEGATNLLPTVNRALTGYENPRLLVPRNDDNFLNIDWANIGESKFVENTPEIEKLENPFGFTGNEFDDATAYLRKNKKALNYKPMVPWDQVKADPSAANILGYMGETAVASLPDMAAVLINTPAYFATLVAPIAEKRAENDGRSQVTPEDLAVAAVTSMGVATAEKVGAKGIFGEQAGNVGQRIVGAGSKEAGTESIQNPLQYAGETVGTETGFDPAQAADQALAGAVGGAGAGSGIRTVNELATVGGLTAPEDPEAATELANRMDRIAKTGGYNRKNVSNNMDVKGARALLDQAHQSINNEIKTERAKLKDRLKPDYKNDSDDVLDLKTKANTAFEQARNKTKNIVGAEEMAAVEQLVGDTAEGQKLLKLMRETDELTKLHNKNLKGGLSRFTDLANPFDVNQGYVRGNIGAFTGKASGTAGIAYATGGQSLLPQAAVVGAGRLVDAVTGQRSRVNAYINQNKARTGGVEQQSAPSVRAIPTERQEENRRRQEELSRDRREAFERNDPITNPNAPIGRVAASTGLDRQQQAALAAEMANDPRFENIREELLAASKSAQEGGQIPKIDVVIGAMAGEVKNRGGAIPESAGYQRGIESNRQLNDQLTEAVLNDTSISRSDRANLVTALNKLRLTLGLNPEQEALDIAADTSATLENPALADQYIMPYVNRVARQQSARRDADEALTPLDFNQINDPMRISPRRPTAKGATENPLTEDLQISSADILNSPNMVENLLPRLMSYVGVRGSRVVGDTRTPERIFIDHVKGNLLHLYNSVTPEYRERARQWYVGANKLSQQAADKHNIPLHQVAGVMAALSPQKDWFMNYDLGMRTIDNYFSIPTDAVFDKPMAKAFRRMIKKQNPKPAKVLRATLKSLEGRAFGEMDAYDQGVFIRFYDEVNNPERSHRIISPEGELLGFKMTAKGEKSGTAWNGFGDIEKAVSILRDGSRENIDQQVGQMHKVRSFYNNILSPMSDRGDVTIDTHAVAAALLRPLSGSHAEVMDNFKVGGKSAITGAVGAYGLYADAYREAAAEVGILPREMQSITWEAVRGLYTPAFKGQKKNQETINKIWQKYDEGGINIDQVRQEIFDVAGRIKQADWERSDNREISPIGATEDAGVLSSTGIPRAGDGRGTGSEPSRPLLRTTQEVNPDFDIAGLTPLEMGEPSAVAADLIARISAMQPSTEADSGLLKFVDKALPEAVKRLDPEGREVASLVQVGLENMKLTNQEIEKVLPHLIDAFNTLTSDENTVISGSYGHPLYKGGQRDISMVGLDQPMRSGTMDGDKWMKTFFHELGHAIERQSGLREAFNAFKYRSIAKDSNYSDAEKAKAKLVYDEAIRLSRERRSRSWQRLDENVQNWRNGIPAHVPSTRELADMTRQDFLELVSEHAEIVNAMGGNSVPFQMQLGRLKEQIDYLHGSGELAADALARYMEVPSYMKKEYPELSEAIRKIVNNSDIAKFITFHSVAGLVGAAGMTSLLMGMDEENDDTKGALSLGSGALSAA